MESLSDVNSTDKTVVISECNVLKFECKVHPFEIHLIALAFEEKRKVLPLCRAISYLLLEYVEDIDRNYWAPYRRKQL